MEVRAKREGSYSELKIHFEIENCVSLTTLEFTLKMRSFFSWRIL